MFDSGKMLKIENWKNKNKKLKNKKSKEMNIIFFLFMKRGKKIYFIFFFSTILINVFFLISYFIRT